MSEIEQTNVRVSSVGQLFNNQPLRFEANVGQADPSADFVSHVAGYNLTLMGQKAALDLAPASPAADNLPPERVQLQFPGANPHPEVVTGNLLSGRSNYFVGQDSSGWLTNVANYGDVTYRDVYPGIDLVYHSDGHGQLEYDFVVAPGADPSRIQVATTQHMDAQGNVVLQTPRGA